MSGAANAGWAFRLIDLLEAEQAAKEIAGLLLAAGRRGDLNVVDAGDQAGGSIRRNRK
jgi:hypothetical protein